MANLRLNHIFKVYDNGVKAVNDFCIDIEDKEFIVFVGPSGCGKSTTLRMIAGLEEITAGELYIGDNLVNDIEPSQRDIAMVFQNYALYPHMTVYDNMAFGLANHHTPKNEIKKRVSAAAKILGLTEYLDRKPKQLSGGQCQRVALGRAIVRQPKVFLLDEPLSNLDAKLRASMRTEISKLHMQLKTTFIYVTHDQVEAMTMGTRIVVMKDGFIQQIDTPINLYNNPINKFVAGFIGTPQMNFFNCVLSKKNDDIYIHFADKLSIKVPYERHTTLDSRYLDKTKKVILGVRPDFFKISKKPTNLKVKVSIVEQLGNESILYGSLLLDKENSTNVTMKIDPHSGVKTGDIVSVEINDKNIHFFDAETEQSIQRVVPLGNYAQIAPKAGKISIYGTEVKLPPYLKSKLGNSKWLMEMPLDSLIEGKDISLKLLKQEQAYDKLLTTLKTKDGYIFSTSLAKSKVGKKAFGIDWTKVKFTNVKNNTIIEPIKDSFVLPIKFNKDSNKMEINGKTKKRFALSFMLGDDKKYLSFVDTDKVLNIFGRKKALKDVYDLNINFADLDTKTKGLNVKVIEYLDYGTKVYAKVDFLGEKVVIPATNKTSKEMNVCYSPKEIEIYEHNSNMKII